MQLFNSFPNYKYFFAISDVGSFSNYFDFSQAFFFSFLM